MKNLTVLFFFTLFFLSSCSKNDDNSNNPEGIEEGTLTAIIDGEEFRSTMASGVIVISPSYEAFGISGPDNLKTLLLSFTLTPEAALNNTTYKNLGDGTDCAQFIEPCLFISYMDTSNSSTPLGWFSVEKDDVQVTFTSIDYRENGHAIGTFSGVLNSSIGQIEIVNGKFNVKI